MPYSVLNTVTGFVAFERYESLAHAEKRCKHLNRLYDSVHKTILVDSEETVRARLLKGLQSKL